MRKISIALFVLLASLIALTLSASAEIVKVPTTKPDVTSTFDTATLVSEDGFRGYVVHLVWDNPAPLTSPGVIKDLVVKAQDFVFEVNCSNTEGRAKRLTFEEAGTGKLFEADHTWRVISGPPASDTLDVIRTRACK